MGRPPHVGVCFQTGCADRPRRRGSGRACLVGNDLFIRLPSSSMEMGAGRAESDGHDCLGVLDCVGYADAIRPVLTWGLPTRPNSLKFRVSHLGYWR